MFFDQTIVRVRAGERADRGGNAVLDWSADAVTRVTITDVSIQPNGAPGAANEVIDAERDAVVTGWRVQSQPGVDLDVTAVDRIEWDSMILDVDGEMARWSDPIDGGVHHVEFTIKRATG